MFFGIALCNGQGFLPILPIAIGNFNGNWRPNTDAVAYPREYVGGIGLDFHSTTAAIALLSTPKLAIEKGLIDFQSSRNPRKECHQGLSMGLSGSEVTQHKFSIVPDAGRQT